MGKLLERRAKATVAEIPELQDGDTLELPDYLKRYEASRSVHRAELLDGIVHIHSVRDPSTGMVISMSPISANYHGEPHADIIFWLKYYSLKTPGTRAMAPATVAMPRSRSAPEPDALLFKVSGPTTVSPEDRLIGAPELVVEISHTTKKRDLTVKKKLYLLEGVAEYIVIHKADYAIDWFVRESKQFEPLTLHKGVFKSFVFPGLWLNVPAFLDSDLNGVIDTLDRGLASPEHLKYVKLSN